MKITLDTSELCLSRRQTLTLADGAGVCIEARSGTVWVTQDTDPRDVVLREGESFRLDRSGPAIVQAFEASRVRLSQIPGRAPARIDWSARLAVALGRWLPQGAWARA